MGGPGVERRKRKDVVAEDRELDSVWGGMSLSSLPSGEGFGEGAVSPPEEFFSNFGLKLVSRGAL